MSIVVGHGYGLPFIKNNIDFMKYTSTINLTADVEYDVTTTISSASVIYNIFVEDSSGNVIEDTIEIRSATSGGVWHVYLTSTESLTSVAVKVLY